MKIELEKKIGFYDVDKNNAIRPRMLLSLFQDAATKHSNRVGDGFTVLMDQGKAWVLYQMGIHIHKAPAVDDDIRIQTWHAGESGFRAYRDYHVTCGPETLVSARSVWLLLDFHQKQMINLTGEIGTKYTLESPIFNSDEFDAWKPWLRPEFTHTFSIALRPSDFDALGHVNNATYFDYLDILVHEVLGDSVKLRAMNMQYSKEIPRGTMEIQAGVQHKEGRYVFKLFSGKVMHAIGDFQV